MNSNRELGEKKLEEVHKRLDGKDTKAETPIKMVAFDNENL